MISYSIGSSSGAFLMTLTALPLTNPISVMRFRNDPCPNTFVMTPCSEVFSSDKRLYRIGFSMRVSFRSVFEGKDSPSARRSEYLHMGRVPSGNTYKRLSGHCRAKIEQYRESAASVAKKMSGDGRGFRPENSRRRGRNANFFRKKPYYCILELLRLERRDKYYLT